MYNFCDVQLSTRDRIKLRFKLRSTRKTLLKLASVYICFSCYQFQFIHKNVFFLRLI